MSIAQFEEDKAQYVEQLEIVLLSLKDDPGNAELDGLRTELESAISMIDESIAELRPKKAAPPPPKPAAPAVSQAPPPPPQTEQPEKWSRENHPAFKKSAQPSPPPPPAEEKEEPQITYQVNDSVMAKWVSGDKGFYAARITSVTGSSSAPMYTVKFKSYDEVETLRAKDIRPMVASTAQKRKADGTPVGTGGAVSSPGFEQQTGTPPPPPPGAPAAAAAPASRSVISSNGAVLSAAASMYTQPREGGSGQAGGSGELGPDGKPVKKFKKIKAKKELEAGKNKWQDFNSKSKFGKSQKKDSMFRTPEGVKGRVGFTGSGQAMRKDPSRSRHVYQPQDELD